MNDDERVMSAGRFAGLSRAAFTRISQMTVILARRASAVCSICYIARSQLPPIIPPSRKRIDHDNNSIRIYSNRKMSNIFQ